ncbi:CORIN [Cordylochernes scorpioides]|uniref:CORIN n=1 Tax=Cordylochernes scorpioides TaxID=51811 RepID=A0ABY6L8X4_9ARAC|nr:CORIN [Cordylochernes scorpioides]
MSPYISIIAMFSILGGTVRPRCQLGHFRCHDGRGCLDQFRVCDGNVDCEDGSDEATNITCRESTNLICPPSHSQVLVAYVKCCS